MTSSADGYTYNAENMLVAGPGGAVLTYDPVGCLATLANDGGVARFGYDGAAMIAQHDTKGAIVSRYVHGPGIDNPIIQ